MKISRELKIGLFALLVVLGFLLGVNFLKGKNIFRKHRTFYAIYNEVDGLGRGAKITIHGFAVGKVEQVSFENAHSGRLLVQMTIYDKIEIPSNTVARIHSLDLLGTKNIELLLGNAATLAKNGDTLTSKMSSSLQQEVSQQVLPLKVKAENLMTSLDTALSIVQSVFNETTLQNLELSFASIRRTLYNLERTSLGLDTLVTGKRKSIERIILNLESLTQTFRSNETNINRILSNFSSISDTLAKANVGQTLRDVNHAVLQVNEAVEKINSGQGSAALLLNDPKLYNNLETASKQLNQLLEDFKLHPNRYINISVFPLSKKRMQYQEPQAK